MRQFKPGQLQSGSLYPITASYALTASFTLGLNTGSLTTTASFNAFTASYTTGSFTGSFKGDGSNLTGIVSSKWTGSNPITRDGNVEITGSLIVSGAKGGINTADNRPFLFDNSGIDRVNWGLGYLKDSNNAQSLDWENRAAFDSAGNTSLDWENKYLYGTASFSETSSVSNQISTRRTSSNSTFYPTMVDSSNPSGDYEAVYTPQGITFNPATSGITANSFTGSLLGTASFAQTALNANTASIANTAGTANAVDLYSFSANVESYILLSNIIATSAVSIGGDSDLRYNSSTNKLTVGSIFANSITSSLIGTASFATSASFVTSASFASTSLTSSLALRASGSLTGSLLGTASFATSASFVSTASFIQTAQTASYVLQAVSASFVTSASFAQTASYVQNAVSASFVSTASFVTASNVYGPYGSNSVISASYALNGGVTQILAGSNITISPTTGKGQVTISSTGGGSSFNTATGSYGSFYDTTTQTNIANTARSMSFNTTDITNGVSISGSTSPYNTYIKTQNAGVYDIQFSAQVDKIDSGTDVIWIWIRKNGVDLADTNTSITLDGNSAQYVAAWNWFVNAAAGDYFQIIWRSADANIRLHAEPSTANYPGIPSVILTVNRIDQFLSNTGSFSGSFTGQLIGTSSWASNATTASYVQNAVSASYVLQAVSASFASTSSFVTASNVIGTVTSASYAITASYALSSAGGGGGDTTAIEAQLWFLL